MANCNVENELAVALGDGLMHNMKLKMVNLSNNKIKD